MSTVRRGRSLYTETVSLCPLCAADSPAFYEEDAEGIVLHVECALHGRFKERIECDADFFKWGYEQEYEPEVGHLILPVTYRCNQCCKYCYTLSNTAIDFPKDRPMEKLVEFAQSSTNNITLIGGEPTMREDLFEIIKAIKETDPGRKVSVGTNGQRLNDIEYVKRLKESDLNFVFLSINDPAYEPSMESYRNKIAALKNCREVRMPVWVQRTINDVSQALSMLPLIEEYSEIIFNAGVRSVRAFGANYPKKNVFLSKIVKALGVEKSCRKGRTPFNRYVRLLGKKTKLCSWANDMTRLEPIDPAYVIADDTLTTFHRGMKMDEVALLKGILPAL